MRTELPGRSTKPRALPVTRKPGAAAGTCWICKTVYDRNVVRVVAVTCISGNVNIDATVDCDRSGDIASVVISDLRVDLGVCSGRFSSDDKVLDYL